MLGYPVFFKVSPRRRLGIWAMDTRRGALPSSPGQWLLAVAHLNALKTMRLPSDLSFPPNLNCVNRSNPSIATMSSDLLVPDQNVYIYHDRDECIQTLCR